MARCAELPALLGTLVNGGVHEPVPGIAIAVLIVPSPSCRMSGTAGTVLPRTSTRRSAHGQALALMRADAVKRRSWLGLLHGELAFWVGRIDGWFVPCSQVGALFASVALVRIPNSYPGGFSETVRRNHSSIPLAAGAAFRRRGPSLGRRVSARQEARPHPTRPSPAASGRGLEQRGLAIRRAWRQSARGRSRRTARVR